MGDVSLVRLVSAGVLKGYRCEKQGMLFSPDVVSLRQWLRSESSRQLDDLCSVPEFGLPLDSSCIALQAYRNTLPTRSICDWPQAVDIAARLPE